MRGSLHKGFTLVELMVTIAVFTILTVVAIPSFLDLRERTAVRGAGDQLVSFWANARLEALKRDQPITVAVHVSGANTCIGATTVSAGCDCFTAAACNVGQYPNSSAAADQADWHGATAVGHPTLGPTDTDDDGLATIDPKRGYLSDSGDVGGVTMKSPGKGRYRLRLYVDRWARPYLCNPTDAAVTLPDYATRTCAP
jgi:prepilin-type N-terminal cleavage/methylation domain-containing protein